MKSLQLTEQEARNFYATGTDDLKKKLADTYGENFFAPRYRDKITDFNDILSIAGITMESLVNVNDTEDEIAYKQAKLIAKVYNGDRVLNPNDTDQYKYFPWFKITPGSGFGLSYYDCADWSSGSDVGVRLCFFDADDAEDAGRKFTEIYSKLLIK